jgi:folate-binding protein YgfZ
MWYKFPAPIILGVSGKDSPRYLNARLSNDCRNLQPGMSVEAAALNAQGRIEGHFLVICREVNNFLLLCEGGEPDTVIQAFTRYIVADRVTVSKESENLDWFYLDLPTPSAELHEKLSQNGNCLVADPRLSPNGFTFVTPTAHREVTLSMLRERCGDELSGKNYHFRRARFATPSFPEEMNEGILLTECKRPSAVSFSKGCYVGQEVIERSDAVGRVPRLLKRITFSKPTLIESGTPVVTTTGDEIGKVISAYCSEDEGLGIVFCTLRNGRFAEGDTVRIGDISGTIV